ncbi:MAG: hypothetical protein GKR89_35025 [Candidatus Latescibacteria bacterium]|nr:hypothetical protein [Candidatus Latescibacterota bacterium]
MHNYQIIIYWNEKEQDFAAEAPELSGCVAYGPTHEEALEAVQQQVATWLAEARADNHPIPQPQGRLPLQPPKQGRGARRLERSEKRRRRREQARSERDSEAEAGD